MFYWADLTFNIKLLESLPICSSGNLILKIVSQKKSSKKITFTFSYLRNVHYVE